jgi:hypothetical protein
MNFFTRRVSIGNTWGGGGASLYVMSLVYKEGLNQCQIHHSLTEGRRWVAHEGNEVIDHTIDVPRNVWWCWCALSRTTATSDIRLSGTALYGGVTILTTSSTSCWIMTRRNLVVQSKTIEVKSIHLSQKE